MPELLWENPWTEQRFASAKPMRDRAGEITFQGGHLTTRGGRIELGSVRGSVDGNNTVILVPVNNGWTAAYSQVKSFQNIQLSQEYYIDLGGK